MFISSSFWNEYQYNGIDQSENIDSLCFSRFVLLTWWGYIINNEQICDKIIDAAMLLATKTFPHLLTQSCNLPTNLLQHNPFANIHIHHNGIVNHFVVTSSTQNSVILYDNLNLHPNQHLDQITAIYSPEKTQHQNCSNETSPTLKLDRLTVVYMSLSMLQSWYTALIQHNIISTRHNYGYI